MPLTPGQRVSHYRVKGVSYRKAECAQRLGAMLHFYHRAAA
jgi:hypothetical protein